MDVSRHCGRLGQLAKLDVPVFESTTIPSEKRVRGHRQMKSRRPKCLPQENVCGSVSSEFVVLGSPTDNESLIANPGKTSGEKLA